MNRELLQRALDVLVKLSEQSDCDIDPFTFGRYGGDSAIAALRAALAAPVAPASTLLDSHLNYTASVLRATPVAPAEPASEPVAEVYSIQCGRGQDAYARQHAAHAAHAAAAEREACAKLVEKMCSGKWVTVDKMAEAIRARTA
jgi:hypothetical protein